MEKKTEQPGLAETNSLRFMDLDGNARPIDLGHSLSDEYPVLASIPVETEELIPTALRRLHKTSAGGALTLLVPPRVAPEDKIRRDDVVTGFLATGPWTTEILTWTDCSPRERCFRALTAALDAPYGSIAIDIVSSPEPAKRAPQRTVPSIDVMLAHRGGDEYLQAAVSSILAQDHHGRTILCFDQDPEPKLWQELASHDALELYEVVPNPAGPYVPRQHFCMTAASDYVGFQDTDDVSLPSRIKTLLEFAEATGADIVGCHELRFDELARTVEAIRLPLDANRALNTAGPGAVQLFATTVTRTECLRRLGGFSTIRTFGADRQFQLRAHWSARMLNVDAFLYIRRLREGSLTTATRTGMQSQIRKDVNAAWREAFHARLHGDSDLAKSALRVEPSEASFAIRDLRTGEAMPAMLNPKVALPNDD